MSSGVFPLVSGTQKTVKSSPTKQTVPNIRNSPEVETTCSRLGPNLPTKKTNMPQLEPTGSASLLASLGNSSAFIVQAKGPMPNEKATMKASKEDKGTHDIESAKLAQSST